MKEMRYVPRKRLTIEIEVELRKGRYSTKFVERNNGSTAVV